MAIQWAFILNSHVWTIYICNLLSVFMHDHHLWGNCHSLKVMVYYLFVSMAANQFYQWGVHFFTQPTEGLGRLLYSGWSEMPNGGIDIEVLWVLWCASCTISWYPFHKAPVCAMSSLKISIFSSCIEVFFTCRKNVHCVISWASIHIPCYLSVGNVIYDKILPHVPIIFGL